MSHRFFTREPKRVCYEGTLASSFVKLPTPQKVYANKHVIG